MAWFLVVFEKYELGKCRLKSDGSNAICKAQEDRKKNVYGDFGSTEKINNRTYASIHILISYGKKIENTSTSYF
jgi:hypothetical protein